MPVFRETAFAEMFVASANVRFDLCVLPYVPEGDGPSIVGGRTPLGVTDGGGVGCIGQ